MVAEILYACSMRGLDPLTADQLELWEIASYLGLHRIETLAQRDEREIVEAKEKYWEETGEARSAKLAGYSERRRQRARERRQERARQREERANA